jgi:TRAP-type C4-dicarboxylate transport system permease small subunit
VSDATRFLERLTARLSGAAEALAAFACLACLALVGYAVAMRYLFNRPQSWTDEAVGWCIVAVVMLAVPEAQRRGENIGVDWLVDRWRGARRRAVIALGALAVAASAAILIVEGYASVAFTRMIGGVSNAIPQFPLWLVQALIPAGAALLLLVAFAQLGAVASGREPEDYETSTLDRGE